MYPAPSVVIPPEIFPLITSFVPLRSAPPTLRSLALGNQLLHDIVRPLLYSRLILRNEDDVIAVFQKILDEPRLGLAVKELYVMSDLSVKARKGEKPFDVLGGIQMLVKKGLIPRLHALGIYLQKGWHSDGDDLPFVPHGRLLADFWSNLRLGCPHLQTLVLKNVGNGSEDLWLSGAAIDDLNFILGLATLRLEWRGDLQGLSAEDGTRIFNNLPHLASSLHTLGLEGKYQHASVILSFDFPNLKRLRLEHFRSHQAAKSMDFLVRHPQLESLSLLDCLGDWLSCDFEKDGFLPNLKHLKARFVDIRMLLLILPQLVSLSFTESSNGQVPYLLRELLSDGLPELKSLEIAQDYADPEMPALEGVLWYETFQGDFRTGKDRRLAGRIERDRRLFLTGYVHSIARGAPFLEELGLHGTKALRSDVQFLARPLSCLKRMKRFYYRGSSPDPMYHRETISDFLWSAKALARQCQSLELLTNISNKHLPYVSAKIKRDAGGRVTRVTPGDGVGMLISAYENDPFPCHT